MLTQDLHRIDDWQRIFGYSEVKAKSKIIEHNADVTRLKVSDEHWSLLPETKKQQFSFDRGAYEHHLQLAKSASQLPQTNPDAAPSDTNTTYICKLGDSGEPLHDAGEVQVIAALSETPKVFAGSGDTGGARFCLVNAGAKRKIEAWLQAQGDEPILFAPYNMIKVGPATKNLSRDSAYPTLGMVGAQDIHY